MLDLQKTTEKRKEGFLCLFGSYCFLLQQPGFMRLAFIPSICLIVRGLWKWFLQFIGASYTVHSSAPSRFSFCSMLFLFSQHIIYTKEQEARGTFNSRLGAQKGGARLFSVV